MAEGQTRVRVWDWTIRVFHWSLVLLVAAMWWTADQGYMMWHKWLGTGLLAVLVYRLVWGLIGPRSARLLGLLPRPSALIGYVKDLANRPYRRSLGHNPIGGLSVLALLSVLFVQTISGMFTVDVNGLASGWFGHLISFDVGRAVSDIHDMSFDVLLVLIGLHVLAIATYAIVLKANLIGPMLTGYQTRTTVPSDYTPAKASILRFACAFGIAALFAGAVIWFGR